MSNNNFEIILVGGGLAGLSLSILLSQKKYKVLLIERKMYPYHKVCGEYISMESYDFIKRLGIPLDEMNLPMIRKFQMTGVHGEIINENLDLGGFGISRYSLDKLLADRAREQDVVILENTTCSGFEKVNDLFNVITNKGNFTSTILCASFGRYSFGDFYKPNKNTENWIGVKYHIKTKLPFDTISLHTFKQGYCGISRINDDAYCLCYLTKSTLLNQYANNIKELEKMELFKNPFLKKVFNDSEFLFHKPITISNVNFSEKKPVFNHVFYLGDSAGAIAPLTGNGMSNAMRSAHILFSEVDIFFQKKISRTELERNYEYKWNLAFRKRINVGRSIQYFFCNPNLTPIFMFILSKSKYLRKLIIKQTHGEKF